MGVYFRGAGCAARKVTEDFILSDRDVPTSSVGTMMLVVPIAEYAQQRLT